MADVSQLTGIPADRIYKWEKGTRPNDAEDLLKIRMYLEGKLEADKTGELQNVPKTSEPSAMQILKVLADAFRDQATVISVQAEILRSIEEKMAREATLARMEPNLMRTLAAALTVAKGQEDAMKELRGLLSPPVRKKAPSRGVDKGRHRIDGGPEKKGSHPA